VGVPQTNGIEGIEKDLLLDTIQIHCCDTSDTPQEFQQRFPVGMWLEILTITEITAKPADCGRHAEKEDKAGKWQGSLQ
jgi:hypothetical protein